MNESASAAVSGQPTPWTLAAQPTEAAADLARELGLPTAIAALLACRGLADPASARAFLNPSLDQLHDPHLMLGMQAAVERLRAALLAQEPILIYGDYDVDGTIATVLLKTASDRAAAAMGVTADVRFHIPHRIREGYGMLDSRIAAAAAEGVRLVISVDTGIRAFAAAEEASRVGLDLIVTDHHLPDDMNGVPSAIAVLNPNQPGCGYPYKEICGAAVAFKLAQALLESSARDDAERQRLREKTLPSFLKLLAIATIADAVPLTGENRTIAALGLRELRQPAQPGLRALMQLAQIDTSRPISATDVAFRVAPRINAAGRMDIASDVVEMFLAKEPGAARTLAEKLHRLNDERRATEAEALRAIDAQIEIMTESEAGLPACLVLDDAPNGSGAATATAWHRGIIGILASRVVDRTGRPALVLTHKDGEAYGSGRSVNGVHLLDALTAAHTDGDGGPLFSRFGGHAHAVGFSLPSLRVGDLRARLLRFAAAHSLPITSDALECDAEVRLGELTPEFLTALEQLGPFGNGNAEPVFASAGVRLVAPLKIIQERHLRLAFQDREDRQAGNEAGARVRFGAMLWGRRRDWAAQAQQQGWSQNHLFDIAYRLRRNWHPDFGGWELEIVDIRPLAQP